MQATQALERIPDRPACVEARGMLLSGRGGVIWSDDEALLVYSPADDLAAVVGPIAWRAIGPAIAEMPPGAELVVRQDDARNAGPVPEGWRTETATVHEEPLRRPLLAAPAHPVRELTAAQLSTLDHLPPDLREELTHALSMTPVMAACDDGLPVAFCYSGWETERWWDVSIDTLERWRNRGYAAAAAGVLMEAMRARGKRAVWAAVDSNTPSLAVARRLGFVAVDSLILLTRE